jgi:riboflavin synthase
MFTGLIQTQGRLLARCPRGEGYKLTFAHDLEALEIGESIAVNGVCLTATRCDCRNFEADASIETVTRTNLGEVPVGGSLHLERALRVGDRFGGHIVSGHVDARIRLLDVTKNGEAIELVFEQPTELVVFIAEKGSVAIDGVSLTINWVKDACFGVMLVPHSQQTTHLGSMRRGDNANLEVDIIARYVVHQARLGAAPTETGKPGNDATNRDASLRRTLARAGLV